MKFRVIFRKRKKFEDGVAPGDKVALELEVGSEELEVKGGSSSRSPLDELKRIAEGRGESRLKPVKIFS